MASIRQATEDDIPALYRFYTAIGKKDEGYFEACFEKDCLILLAENASNVVSLQGSDDSDMNDHHTAIVGFVILNFEPKYALYQKLEIPEIQDLNVLPDQRLKGIGTQLVMACEDIAIDQGEEQIGISVGLNKEYGAAQRLYIKLDYIPDGNGITYDREPVTPHQSYPADDHLCLMMVKDLI